MKTPFVALLSAVLLLHCSFPAQAQFGGLKDAARKAEDAMPYLSSIAKSLSAGKLSSTILPIF